jgi:hypothetical protein
MEAGSEGSPFDPENSINSQPQLSASSQHNIMKEAEMPWGVT